MYARNHVCIVKEMCQWSLMVKMCVFLDKCPGDTNNVKYVHNTLNV